MNRLLAALAGLTLAIPASAADVDSHLPPDAQLIVSLNVEQLTGSALGKKHLVEMVKEAIGGNAEAQKVLKEIGLDPLRDFHRVTIAGDPTNPENAFVIVNGKFDRAKIEMHVKKAAETEKDKVKIHADGNDLVVEVSNSDGKPMFATFASENTILLASEKKALSDARKRNGGTSEVKKEVAELIKKADSKQTAWVVARLGKLVNNLPLPLEDKQKETIEKIDAVSGNVNVTDSVSLELTLATKDEAAAKELHQTIDGFLKLFAAFGGDPKITKLLQSIKNNTNGTNVTLKVTVDAELVEEALKRAGG
jgi:hypothetical protein